MIRYRSVLVALACAAALGAAPSHAVNSLAFTMVVPCDDPDGVNSDDIADVEFPTGAYAVTITGACLYGFKTPVSIGTPCEGPAGPMPCAAVDNLPHFCAVNAAAVETNDCGQSRRLACAGWTLMVVDGQCASLGSAGTIRHDTPGPIRAYFWDTPGWYWDNVGAYVVTLIWTPL